VNQNVSLSLLVSRYQATGSDELFSEIYNIVSSEFPKKIHRLAKRFNLDEPDVESIINLKIFEVVRKFDRANGEFMKQLNSAIKHGCIDLLRKDIAHHKEINETRLTANFAKEESADYFDTLTPIEVSDEMEEIAIANIQKKRDQRQLIAAILSSTDEDTRQSASAFMETGSYGAAAKLLGTTDKKKIHRHIKRLSRHFDGNQNGDYHDYFTVATVHVG
jgi:Glu-tRNA(Gln) amidotransferase subunit E-like FAD-binding protein